MGDSDGRETSSGRWFATTQWSMVIAAGESKNPEHDDALTRLCEIYWYPVYAYLRRRSTDRATAEDLAQGFFADLLGRKGLKVADRERGKFRTFMLTSAKHYAINERERGAARKRGGDRSILSLDFTEAEDRYVREPADPVTPEVLFHRRWARTVLDETIDRLRHECEQDPHPERARRLIPLLTSEDDAPSYREIGEELGMSPGAVRVAVHRLRKRYGQLLREEVARTVEDAGAIDEEIKNLFAALRS